MPQIQPPAPNRSTAAAKRLSRPKRIQLIENLNMSETFLSRTVSRPILRLFATAAILLLAGGMLAVQGADAVVEPAAVAEAVQTTAEEVTEAASTEVTADLAMFTTNNLWMVIAAALVFIMHLGFACVESGLTQSKNTTNILFKNSMVICIGLLTYALCGFNLMYPAFEDGDQGWIKFAGLGLSPGEDGLTSAYNPGYTYWTNFLFQAMFESTAATIVPVPWQNESNSPPSSSSLPSLSPSAIPSLAAGSGAPDGWTASAFMTLQAPPSCTRSVVGRHWRGSLPWARAWANTLMACPARSLDTACHWLPSASSCSGSVGLVSTGAQCFLLTQDRFP